MINKINLELDVQQVEQLVERLPQSDKIRLFRRLGQQTALQRMREIFKEIDERRRKFAVSDKEIQEELAVVRRKIYGPRRR